MAGRLPMPEQFRKAPITIRVYPFLSKFVRENGISLSAELQTYLIKKYGHRIEIDPETIEMLEKYTFNNPSLAEVVENFKVE